MLTETQLQQLVKRGKLEETYERSVDSCFHLTHSEVIPRDFLSFLSIFLVRDYRYR